MKKLTYLAPEMILVATEQADVLTFSHLVSSNGDEIGYSEGRSI